MLSAITSVTQPFYQPQLSLVPKQHNQPAFGKLNLPLDERPVVALADVLKQSEPALEELLKQLKADGFARLNPEGTPYQDVGIQALNLAKAFVNHQEELVDMPSLAAPNPVSGGLSRYFQVEEMPDGLKRFGQLITAIVGKPIQAKAVEQPQTPLPEFAEKLLTGLSDTYNKYVYGMLHDVFQAIAQHYDIVKTEIDPLVTKKNGGAVRLIHYSNPVPLSLSDSSPFLSQQPQHPLGIKGIPKHIDTSLLTGNFGETASGLAHVDADGDLTIIPSQKDHVIVTVGDMLANMTKDTLKPLPPFKHTVMGDKRSVTVGFYSPDYDATMKTWGKGQPLGTTEEHYKEYLPDVEQTA
jgi:isopenicillin N synthase-like dioxygenase